MVVFAQKHPPSPLPPLSLICSLRSSAQGLSVHCLRFPASLTHHEAKIVWHCENEPQASTMVLRHIVLAKMFLAQLDGLMGTLRRNYTGTRHIVRTVSHHGTTKVVYSLLPGCTLTSGSDSGTLPMVFDADTNNLSGIDLDAVVSWCSLEPKRILRRYSKSTQDRGCIQLVVAVEIESKEGGGTINKAGWSIQFRIVDSATKERNNLNILMGR
ncbi:hypothetical protein LZ32DRAFT_63143 [Colletotrichum eremochloae]|nr:hypothetical protein LZ32DRAFT_63143 [Colletotrichum eremochloae]